jgi:prevent-host-death family protein
MKRVSASDAKNRFGGLLEEAAMHGRVDIVRHGRVVGILLSPKAFQELGRHPGDEAGWGAAHAIPPPKAGAARMVKPPGDYDE